MINAIADVYLTEVRDLLQDYPGTDRAAFLSDLDAHIKDATYQGLSIDTILLNLGDPAQIAETFVEGLHPNHTYSSTQPRRRRKDIAIFTGILILAGAFLGVTYNILGLLLWIAGLVLLWIFPWWTLRSKILASAGIPISWFFIVILRVPRWVSSRICTDTGCYFTAPLLMRVLGWTLIAAAAVAAIYSVGQLYVSKNQTNI